MMDYWGSVWSALHIVRRVAEECGSTAMVLTMHYCGAAVLEAHSPVEVRRAAATAYVWSSKPVSAEGFSTLWLVPAQDEGFRCRAV